MRWIRAVLLVLLVAGVAVIAWRMSTNQTAPSVTASKPQPDEKAHKPAPASDDLWDTSRERPDLERDNRPGDKRSSP